MACVLQRLPGHLQKLAVLGIHDRGFLGAEAEEVGVKLLETVQYSSGWHVVAVPHAVGALATGQQLFFAEVPYRLDAPTQIGPVSLRIDRTGKVGRHADDGNIVAG